MRTYLPKSFTGGLMLTHVSDPYTNVALKVNSPIADRYFDSLTLKTNAIGMGKQIPIVAADHIDIFMATATKFVAATDGKPADNTFAVKFTRSSNADLILLASSMGGTTIWIIEILMAIFLCIGCCLSWKYCKTKEGDDKEEGRDFYQEDSYVRI